MVANGSRHTMPIEPLFANLPTLAAASSHSTSRRNHLDNLSPQALRRGEMPNPCEAEGPRRTPRASEPDPTSVHHPPSTPAPRSPGPRAVCVPGDRGVANTPNPGLPELRLARGYRAGHAHEEICVR